MDEEKFQSMSVTDNATTSSENESTVIVGVIEPEIHEPKAPSAPDVHSEFNNLFFSIAPLNKTPLEILKQNAYSGALSHSPLRGLAWRIFLNCLNIEAIDRWESIITTQRANYSRLLDEHYVDPRKEAEVFDPLSVDENSPWNIFFRNRELQKTITLDIERTYPDNEFFQNTSIKEIMLRVLFIYSKTNSQISYRQGMHELLAPMLYLFHSEVEKFKKSEDAEKNPTIVDIIYDKNFLEHDLFTVFLSLMKHTSNWFGMTPSAAAAAAKTTTTPSTPSPLHSQPSFNLFAEQEPKKESTPVVINEAVQKCKNINKLLRQKDPELSKHLETLGIEPQIYLLRWIRLLFGREFHLEDVLNMWDSLFAYGEDLILIDYVSISMLVYIREQLLTKDNSGVLKRLFKYPPVEDIHSLINQAFTIKDSAGQINLHNNYNYQKPNKHKDQNRGHNHHNNTNNNSNSINNTFKSPDPTSKNSPTSNIFQPFSSLLHDPLGTISSTTSKYATISSPLTSPATPSTPKSTISSSTTTPTTATPKVISSSATTSIYGDSLFAKPAQTISTSTDSPKRSVNISSSDLFESAKKDIEPLGLLTTSVNITTARSNYLNKRASVAVTKTSSVTAKPNINAEIKRLRNIQKYIGNSLGDIIPKLQAGFNDNPNLVNHDSLMLAVAQVKQIKDMLLGDLPLPENIPDYEDQFDADVDAEDPLSSK